MRSTPFSSSAADQDRWPSAIPTYPGAKVLRASKGRNSRGIEKLAADQETADAADAVLKFYTEKATAAGYAPSGKFDGPGAKSVNFQKGKAGENGSTTIAVSVRPAVGDASKNNLSLAISTTTTPITTFPDAWPREVPAYTNGTLLSASTDRVEDLQGVNSTQETNDASDVVLKFYADKLTASGYQQVSKVDGSGADALQSLSFQKGKRGAADFRTVSVAVGPGIEAKLKNEISITSTSN